MDTNLKHNTSNDPVISVVMGLYNGEAFLREAIDSILTQTFQNFELIIVDDCSTDTSREIVQSYTNPRIILLKNEKNIGLGLTLDRGISASRGEYIARMDQDDVSLPHRFEHQLAYMEAHPNIDICGAWVKTIGAKAGQYTRHPTDPDEINVNLLFHTSLVHPTIIIRKAFLLKYGLRYSYTDGRDGYIEDFDLYTRAMQYGTLANQGEVLLHYRRHEKQTTVEKIKTQVEYSKKIFRRELEHLGLTAEETDLENLASVKRYLFLEDTDFPKKLEKTLLKIETANDTARVYTKKALRKVFGRVWLEVCLALAINNKDIWNIFWKSEYRRWIPLTSRNIFRFGKIFFGHYR